MGRCSYDLRIIREVRELMKSKVPKRLQKKASDIPVAAMKSKVTGSFGQQVAGFIRRYRPALEALAKR